MTDKKALASSDAIPETPDITPETIATPEAIAIPEATPKPTKVALMPGGKPKKRRLRRF